VRGRESACAYSSPKLFSARLREMQWIGVAVVKVVRKESRRAISDDLECVCVCVCVLCVYERVNV